MGHFHIEEGFHWYFVRKKLEYFRPHSQYSRNSYYTRYWITRRLNDNAACYPLNTFFHGQLELRTQVADWVNFLVTDVFASTMT